MTNYELRGVAERYHTKRDLTYHSLRAAILRCDLQPGEEFTVRDVAEQVGVSPSPVREALSRLEGEGLVESASSRGFRVGPVSWELAREVRLVLGALLPLVCRQACERMTPEVLAELEALCRKADEELERRSRGEKLPSRPIAFHRALCRVCQMPYLEKTVVASLDLSDWSMNALVMGRDDLAQERLGLASSGHWKVYEALKGGDPDTVERVARDHAQESLDWFMEQIPDGRDVEDTHKGLGPT